MRNGVLKTRFLTLSTAFVLAFLTSCNESVKTTGDLSKNSTGPINGRKQGTDKPVTAAQAQNQDDWGEAPLSGSAKKTGVPKPSAGSASKLSEGQTSITTGMTSTWSLVLGTFTDTGHAEAARQMAEGLRTIAPQAAGARVHSTSKGSMVVYGHYSGREDAAAKNDQERLKAVTFQGRKVFDRIILTRLDLRLTSGVLHPHDLLSARRAHPKVNPMYTLEIAIWMSNEEGESSERVTFDEVKKKAESYAQQLRVQGNEAYFYHNEARRMSEVTVGLFDSSAINQVSGLYSEDVTALIKKFPTRMANGEIMYEPIYMRDEKDPNVGKTRARAQTPVLVLVPTM